MTLPRGDSLNDDRVVQAHAEVGQTAVSRAVAVSLTALLATAIGIVPLAQGWLAPEIWRLGAGPAVATSVDAVTGRETPIARVLTTNRHLLEMIRTLTDQVDNDSVLARFLRPLVQGVMTRLAGVGNERVLVGRDGWLYYAADLQHVVGPGFLDPAQLARRSASGSSLAEPPEADPRPALFGFNEALARRGITLVVMPTPVKPAIHPEQLTALAAPPPLRNLSFSRFRDELQAAGVLVFDPAPVLAGAARSASPAYLATDTHWRPDAMEAVATSLADFLRRHATLAPSVPTATTTVTIPVSNRGDTLDLLGLPEPRAPAAETVTIRQVRTSDGQLWRPSPTADVLVLGDSFSNIYSQDSMGWGRGAGLPERLGVALGRPIDVLSQNDNGAFATRTALARELARNPDRLASTRVVVYQFATRELSHGDWRLVDLDEPFQAASPVRSPATGPFASVLRPTPGRTLTVRGRVRQRAPAPRPGTVPYRDHIIAIELADIEGDDPTIGGTVALVYLSSMEDNVWTPAATLPAGAVVTLSLRPWAEVAPERDAVTRAELTQGDVVFAPAWWGTLTTP